MTRVGGTVLVLLLAFGWASEGRADALPPPTRQCPPGARLEVGHGFERCVPTTCVTDANCPAAQPSCRVQALCVETRTEERYRSFPPREGETPVTVTIQTADSVCRARTARPRCAAGECVSAKRCMPRAAPSRPPTIRVPPPTVSKPLALVLSLALGGLGVVLASRRRAG